MEKVTIEDVDERIDSSTLQRPLSRALGAENLTLNYYELAPGDSFAYGYHKHADQEEVFLVTAGTVTFETEDGAVTVGEGEAILFSPNEFQQGTNRGEERVVAFAIGAPLDSGETEILRDCEACGERTPQTIEWVEGREGQAKRTVCLDCGETTGVFT